MGQLDKPYYVSVGRPPSFGWSTWATIHLICEKQSSGPGDRRYNSEGIHHPAIVTFGQIRNISLFVTQRNTYRVLLKQFTGRHCLSDAQPFALRDTFQRGLVSICGKNKPVSSSQNHTFLFKEIGKERT